MRVRQGEILSCIGAYVVGRLNLFLVHGNKINCKKFVCFGLNSATVRTDRCRFLMLLQLLRLSLVDVMRLLLANDVASDSYSVTPTAGQAVSSRDVTVYDVTCY